MLPALSQVCTLHAAFEKDIEDYAAGRRVSAVDRGRAASAACVTCHGNEGQGDAPKLIPAIAGQAAGYIRNQLVLFKANTRSPGDPALTQLKSVLRTIPDETLADIAAYYASLK